MLTQLHIRNLAIIHELDLDFKPGMTVLTGETGAGKSILIDALGLILGDRGDSSVIRDGCDKAEIVACFDISTHDVIQAILDEQSVSYDDRELTIRRVINKDGRSKAYVNSSVVPVQVLRNIGESLINIHGQHTHQSLTNRTYQRFLLDSFANHDSLLEELNEACTEWSLTKQHLSSISNDNDSYSSTIELLNYQIKELDEMQIQADEYDALEGEYKRLSNVSDLIQVTQQALQLLSEQEHSAEGVIQRTIHDFRDLQKSDSKLGKFAESLEDVSIQLNDTIDEIRQYSTTLESDPDRLHEVDKRLNLMMDIARKHQTHPRELHGYLTSLKSRLDELESNRNIIDELTEKQAELWKKYQKLARQLHDSRVKAAKSMAKTITGHLASLGMPNGKLIIEVSAQESDQPQRDGHDQIELLVSLNPGSKPQPMRKVASGGELSRLSLAIQLVSKQARIFPILIFDEVDAGIGGKTADIVGSLLKDLAKLHQVLCVTHLPQVASRGDNHLQVTKSMNANMTYTHVNHLDENDRVDEIARMLGGMRVSKKTLEHAREMLTH